MISLHEPQCVIYQPHTVWEFHSNAIFISLQIQFPLNSNHGLSKAEVWNNLHDTNILTYVSETLTKLCLKNYKYLPTFNPYGSSLKGLRKPDAWHGWVQLLQWWLITSNFLAEFLADVRHVRGIVSAASPLMFLRDIASDMFTFVVHGTIVWYRTPQEKCTCSGLTFCCGLVWSSFTPIFRINDVLRANDNSTYYMKQWKLIELCNVCSCIW